MRGSRQAASNEKTKSGVTQASASKTSRVTETEARTTYQEAASDDDYDSQSGSSYTTEGSDEASDSSSSSIADADYEHFVANFGHFDFRYLNYLPMI